MAAAIDGFAAPATRTYEGISRPVYVSSAGRKPLIVLHELPGMSPTFIDYCRRMADLGYKVHMPLMFLAPGSDLRNPLQLATICIRAEFRELFWGRPATSGKPFTRWLLGLIGDVARSHPEQRIGVIGMCLTGGFALAGFAHPGVAAAIACQPSIPMLGDVTTLGLTAEQRKEAQAGAARLPSPCAKAYRYEGDTISKRGHVEAAAMLLGPALAPVVELPGAGHSTLTGATASRQVFDDVLAFLSTRL